MAVSEAQMRAVKKYNKKAYYRPAVCLKREYEEPLRKKAEAEGLSVSSYIQKLIIADIEKSQD